MSQEIPNESAVEREIKFLSHLRQTIPSPDARGNNVHGAIDAQLIVLHERLTRENMIERLRGALNDCHVDSRACDAADWLDGSIDESPSEGWNFEGQP